MKAQVKVVVLLGLLAGGGWLARPYWEPLWQEWRGTAAADASLTLYGNVDIRQISLAFAESGRVLEMHVEEGDRVKAGDVLARLDDEALQLQLRQARAEVEVLRQSWLALQQGSRAEEIRRAEAEVKAAKAEAERTRLQKERLQKAGKEGLAVSKLEQDNARWLHAAASAQVEAGEQALQLLQQGARAEDIAAARAQVEAGEAQVALLQYRIGQTTLRAPQDAVVRARLLEAGDMASSSRTAYTLALDSAKWVRAYVNEGQLGQVREGMAAQVFTDSYPDAAMEGVVGYISSVAEFTPKTVQTPDLRTDLVYEIRVRVADVDNRLRLGMPATVVLQEGQ